MVTLDLRGIAPTPQRLIELIHGLLSQKPEAVLIDWSIWYPWSLDNRTSPVRYTEDLVSACDRAISEAGVEQWMLLRSRLPHGFNALSTYRELSRAEASSDNARGPGLRKLVSDLYDDIIALQPHLQGVVFFPLGDQHNEEKAEDERGVWLDAAAGDSRSIRNLDEMQEYVIAAARDFRDPGGDILGSTECRCGELRVPGAMDTEELHQRLSHARLEFWELVASVHERLSDAEGSRVGADSRLVRDFVKLRDSWRGFTALLLEVRVMYRLAADPLVLDHWIRRLSAGPRKELSALHARVSLIRSAQ
jgi:hypothetical protein